MQYHFFLLWKLVKASVKKKFREFEIYSCLLHVFTKKQHRIPAHKSPCGGRKAFL